MMTVTLESDLKLQCQSIVQELERLIPSQKGPCEQLFDAARYTLLSGGKRLRPILTLTTTAMLNGDLHAALTPACTLELIHTYSMIHDDLPSMDNDDFRRGKPTLHKKFPEGHAILTGDFLLTYAFEVLADAPHLTAEKRIELIKTLAKSSGSEGMIGGQVMDLANEGKKISIQTLELLHKNKTAALITAAIEFGGIISDVPSEHLICLRHFGESMGLAFQVVDDILDVTSSLSKHGKEVASDILNEKSTYVSLIGLEEARAQALKFYHQAVHALQPLPYNTGPLLNLADYVINRTF